MHGCGAFARLWLLARGPRMSTLQLICTDAVPRARFLEVVFHRRCDNSRSGASFAFLFAAAVAGSALSNPAPSLASAMRQRARKAPRRLACETREISNQASKTCRSSTIDVSQ